MQDKKAIEILTSTPKPLISRRLWNYEKNMKKKNHDLFIALIRFGRDNLLSGVTPRQILEHLRNKGFELNMEDSGHIEYFFFILNEIFINGRGHGHLLSNMDSQGDNKCYLKNEAYFNLLDFEELQEAMKNSREARIWAIVAIAVSVILGSIQLFSTIKIDENQFNRGMQVIESFKCSY